MRDTWNENSGDKRVRSAILAVSGGTFVIVLTLLTIFTTLNALVILLLSVGSLAANVVTGVLIDGPDRD